MKFNKLIVKLIISFNSSWIPKINGQNRWELDYNLFKEFKQLNN